jgi:hypothetical protein
MHKEQFEYHSNDFFASVNGLEMWSDFATGSIHEADTVALVS